VGVLYLLLTSSFQNFTQLWLLVFVAS